MLVDKRIMEVSQEVPHKLKIILIRIHQIILLIKILNIIVVRNDRRMINILIIIIDRV